MPKLYVANTSQQRHHFLYSLPEKQGYRTQVIEIGTQALIYNGQLSRVEIDHIIWQKEPYGLVSVDEIPRHEKFIGLCYSLDREIDIDRLLHAYDHNEGVHQQVAQKNREVTSAAIAEDLQRTIGVPMNRVEVEIVQDTPPNVRPDIAAGVEIVNGKIVPRHGGEFRRHI